MLEFFRTKANGLIAKLIIGVMLVVFISWGFNDIILNNNSKDNYAVRVGNTGVSVQEWSNMLAAHAQQMSQMYNTNITEQDLSNVGLTQEILERAKIRALFMNEANKAGVVVTDDMAKIRIASYPQFIDKDNKFSSQQFDEFLKNNNIKEADLIKFAKEEIERMVIWEPFMANQTLPTQNFRAVNKALNLTKSLVVYEVDCNAIKLTQNISEDEIKDFYNKNIDDFKTNETRDIEYLEISMQNVDASELKQVSDEELRGFYESKKDMLDAPERRRVQYIVFATRELADQAYKELSANKSFEKFLKQHSPNQKPDSNHITRNNAPENVVNAVFATDKGDITKPIDIDGKFIIFKVESEHEAGIVPFDEIKNELKENYINEKRSSKLEELINEIKTQIQPDNTNDKLIDEIAKKYGLRKQLVQMKSGGEQELSQSDKTAQAQQKLLPIKSALFNASQNKLLEPMQIASEVYAVANVVSIEPSKALSVDEVKEKIITQLENEARQEACITHVQNLKAQVSEGKSIDQLTKPEFIKINSRSVEANRGNLKEIKLDMMRSIDLFNLKNGATSNIVPIGNLMYTFAYVLNTEYKNGWKDEPLEIQIDQMLPERIFLQYLEYMKSHNNVVIKDGLINKPSADQK